MREGLGFVVIVACFVIFYDDEVYNIWIDRFIMSK